VHCLWKVCWQNDASKLTLNNKCNGHDSNSGRFENGKPCQKDEQGKKQNLDDGDLDTNEFLRLLLTRVKLNLLKN